MFYILEGSTGEFVVRADEYSPLLWVELMVLVSGPYTLETDALSIVESDQE